MFTKKTVLILGAGASCDYGYPTGAELVKNIIKSIQNVEYVNSYDEEIKMMEDPKLKNLCQKLEDFNPINIDYFLKHHTDVQDAGKRMIAYEILKCELKSKDELEEERSNKESNKNMKDWYRYLFHAITSGCENPEDLNKNLENLFIITFNYDISLESYIKTRLSQTEFFKDVQEDFCQEFFKNNIIHVYGKIRDLYEEKDQKINKWVQDHKANQPCTITKEPVLLIYSTQLKENIEVIGGKNDKQKGINKEAAEWISAAEKLFILGFGFDSNNIDKIGLLKFKGFISKVNSSGGKSTFDRELYYTNLGDHQKIERKISKGLQRIKSTKVIEEALSQDFDLIDN